MTHNLVFAGQPRRIATLPQHGQGAISMCYRGLSPLNQNVARRGDMGHAKCGINFPLVATVGYPVMAVCDTVRGRTNPDEGVVLYLLEHSGKSGLVIWCSHTVVNSPWKIPGRSSRSFGLCTPLQSKIIQNSRVLGYGRLNGHVASIVSMFSQRMF